MKTSAIPEQECPCCGHRFNAATNDKLYSPKPYDISICINCASILQFDTELALHEIDIEKLYDLEEFSDNERIEIIRLQKYISHQLHKKHITSAIDQLYSFWSN